MNRVPCPHCQEPIFETEVFCPACGERVIKSDEEIAAEAERRIQKRLFQGELCFPLSGDLLIALRDQLQEGERIYLSVQNIEDSLAVVATNRRGMVLRVSKAMAGASGVECESLPYGSIAEIKAQRLTELGTLMIGVMRIAGKPETGRRARMGKKVFTKIPAIPLDKLDRVVAGLQRLVEQAHAQLKAQGKL